MRKKVTAIYENQDEVKLVKDNGSTYMTLREGDSFFTGLQLRPWFVVKVPRKDGHGTILECQKYRDNGSILERFAIPNHKIGLWALTAGAARNGVFHRYNTPDDPVQELADSTCVCAEKVDSIDDTVYLSAYETKVYMYTDGKITDEPTEDVRKRTFHVTGGTFLFAYFIYCGEVCIKALQYTQDGIAKAMATILWIDRYNNSEAQHAKLLKVNPGWESIDFVDYPVAEESDSQALPLNSVSFECTGIIMPSYEKGAVVVKGEIIHSC